MFDLDESCNDTTFFFFHAGYYILMFVSNTLINSHALYVFLKALVF